MSPDNRHLAVRPEVRQALAARQPVLALESTLITHGLPWPRNLDAARQVERVVREQGVTPATIAVLDGRMRVGLGDDQLERLARLGGNAVKCSRRDIPFVMRQHRAAGTTVAATMLIARMAGIRLFATGGIGGVHRGAGASLDVSADLQELSRTPVAVVCAGPKAILDIALTREYLETHGVPVIGYRTDDLPMFYARSSGYPVDYRLDSPAEVAGLLRLQWDLGLGGVVIANPVPEEHALDPVLVEATVARALLEAERDGIGGKVLTPFLLARIDRITGGQSLDANIAVILSNARLGAHIALAFHANSPAVTLECVQGDITRQPDVDAIVNAANAELRTGGGVAGAIHRAAGPGLEAECRPLAPIRPGEAVITGAHALPNRRVIHCLGPVYGRDEPAAGLLAACYRNALRLADGEGLGSVAFPAISTGVFGYPLAEAARVAVRAVRETLPRLTHVQHIRFVLFDASAREAFQRALGARSGEP